MGFLKFVGCLVKLVLGLAAFVGGAVAVLVLGLPYSVGRGAVALAVDEFNANYQGRLDVDDSHLFDLFGRQEVERFELRDPMGRVVARGSVEASSITGWMRDGLDLGVHVEHASVIREESGLTNLARALTPRDPGERAARDDADSGGGAILIDGEPLTPSQFARLFYGSVRELNLTVDELLYEDRTFEDEAVVAEARDLRVTWVGGPDGQELGVIGHAAAGTVELSLRLGDWPEEAPAPVWRWGKLKLNGTSTHTLDPWVERATGHRGLARSLGPRLTYLELEAQRTSEVGAGPAGRLQVVGEGFRGALDARWSSEGRAVVAEGPDALTLEFDDASDLGRSLVASLLPHVDALVAEEGARSSLRGGDLVLQLGPDRAALRGTLRLDLASRASEPSALFGELEELVAFGPWTFVDEPIELQLADGRVAFEIAHEGEGGQWVLHGSRGIAGHELEASVRLPGSGAAGAGPTIVRVVRAGDEVSVVRAED